MSVMTELWAGVMIWDVSISGLMEPYCQKALSLSNFRIG